MDANGRMASLGLALNVGELVKVELIARTLPSTSVKVGASNLSDMLLQLESAAFVVEVAESTLAEVATE